MSLSDRIAANRCRVAECQRERVADAAVCKSHLADLWNHRLDRGPDGSFVPRRVFVARDLTRFAA